MRLIRYSAGENYCSQGSKTPNFSTLGTVQKIRYDFYRFGNGYARQSDFGVYVEWEDLEKMIQTFADGGHPLAAKILADVAALERVKAALEDIDNQPQVATDTQPSHHNA